jgi:hypothetical protein
VLTFFSNISQRKHVFGAQIEHFFTTWGLKEGRGRKCVVSRIYEVKG